MKKSTFIIILILVAVLVYLYTKAQAIKNITFNPTVPKKFKADGFAIAWEQGLEANNGDFANVTINNIVAAISHVSKVNNADIITPIGSVTLTQDTVIKGNSVTTIPLKVRIPVTNILSLIIGTIEDVKNRVFRFNIKGTIRGESVQIPFDENFTYLIPSF